MVVAAVVADADADSDAAVDVAVAVAVDDVAAGIQTELAEQRTV